jgi:TetR/AcrR family transcriptional regulator, fatty acid metabolism regulator protein
LLDTTPHRDGRRTTVLRPDVHARLEKAVLEIFSESDFHKANIRDVARKAGVSFTTIYKHYGSKERLVFSFVDIWLGNLTERITDHLQGIEDLKEKMRKVYWLQLDYYERHPGLGKILFMTLPMQTWMSDQTFRQKRMINLYLEVLKRGQAEGILNPQVRAGVLLDFMLGSVQRAFFMWVSRGQQKSLAGQSQVLFDMVWRAIARPSDNP